MLFGELKHKNYIVEIEQPEIYVDNEKRNRSGHMPHAMAELRREDGSCFVYDEGILRISYYRYGTTMLGNLSVRMSDESGIVVIKLFLKDDCNTVVMRNFLLFDVEKMLDKFR